MEPQGSDPTMDQLGPENPDVSEYGTDGTNPFAPLVQGWRNCIERGFKAKKKFQDVADECKQFYAGRDGFMWKADFKGKFFSKNVSPNFHMTMNKAFELVAIYGPVLYHKNPIRQVNPRESIPVNPDMYGVTPEFLQYQQQMEQYSMAAMQPPMPGMQPPMPPMLPPGLQDPMAMMQQQQAFAMYQQAAQYEEQQMKADMIRADLMQRILNYTPNEMPGGGLRHHSQLAITESLLTGRGTLWTVPHQREGMEIITVVDEYDSVDNLIIDPDATRIEEAMWVARRCVHPTWKVEQDYGWPKGSLKGRGSLESADSQERSRSDYGSDFQRMQGGTTDLMVYYKIWSKMGIGARLTGVKAEFGDVIEDVLGDYVYMVVAPNVPYFLNLPPDIIEAADDEQIAGAAAWPVPFYKDERWPVKCLDYYTSPGSCWPISPLAPGLGELKFLNTMMSHLANRIWMSSRDFIAVVAGATDELKRAIKSGEDQCIIEIQTNQADIAKQVQFLQQPQTNLDAWRIVEWVSEAFDKRVGLSEMLYGLTSTQIRSATEASAKQSQISVRPDYMAEKVEEWLTEVSRSEALVIRWFFQPQDVAPILGDVGAQLWQQYVMSEEVDKVAMELEYRIEESSARKPNNDRDVANINQAFQMFGPIMTQYAQATGDTNPINALMKAWGKAAQCDVSGMLLPPMPPPPPPMPPGQEGEESNEGQES